MDLLLVAIASAILRKGTEGAIDGVLDGIYQAIGGNIVKKIGQFTGLLAKKFGYKLKNSKGGKEVDYSQLSLEEIKTAVKYDSALAEVVDEVAYAALNDSKLAPIVKALAEKLKSEPGSAKLADILKADYVQQIVQINQQINQQVNINNSSVTIVHSPSLLDHKPKVFQDIYQNLPAPNYTEFIGRKAEMSRLLQLLSYKHSAHIITVDGIGGVGKTSIVLEAAYRCLAASRKEKKEIEKVKGGTRDINSTTDTVEEIPTFDAIIFTSAKEQILTAAGMLFAPQARRNLRDIFKTISDTLDDLRITQANPNEEEQIDSVRQSLARKRTLLIVDNMETMRDTQNILSFLYDLPNNVKVVITTREQVVFVPIRLPNLPLEDGLRLIRQQAEEKVVRISESQARELYRRTAGVPIAIVYSIGRIARGYPLESVLTSLANHHGDVAKFCFQESVQALGLSQRQLLMSLAIFNKAPRWEVLAEVSGLATNPLAVNDGLATLQQISLITQENERYSMLSLTREYALSELAQHSNFRKELRERWVNWYINFAKQYGGEEWNDWHLRYDCLEEEWSNLLAVLDWCAQQERYKDVTTLWRYLNDYADLYRSWNERLVWMDWLIHESQRRGDWQTYVYGMARKSWTLKEKGEFSEAEKRSLKAWELRQEAEPIVRVYLANSIARLYTSWEQYDEACKWLCLQEKMANEFDLSPNERERFLVNALYFRAKICALENQAELAKELFQQVIERGEKIQLQRFIIRSQNWLARFAICEQNFEYAENLLNKGLTVSERNKDRRCTADFYASKAKLAFAKGDIEESKRLAHLASNNFRRLDMSRSEKEMESLLQQLCDLGKEY
jgi:NB-ARC domain